MIRAEQKDPAADSGQPHGVEGLPGTEPAPPISLTSHEVLRGQKAVSITHNGALYRLQTTRQGKLILTK